MSSAIITTALPHGTRLLEGKFAIGPALGQNSFSITYKGGDLLAKRYVAIKEFFPTGALRQGNELFCNSADAQEFNRQKMEFWQEANLLSQIQHDSVVRVHEVFAENSSVYVVMEFLEGENLAQSIARQGSLSEKQVLEIANQLTSALSDIHLADILHGNIKPENVMLSGSRAVLIDFRTPHSFQSKTQTISRSVTEGYTPAELYTFSARRSPATDIYALGATLYHALTGQRPVDSTARISGVPLIPISALNPTITQYFNGAIMQSLEMKQERRPRSAAEFGALLKRQVPLYRVAASDVVQAEEKFATQQSAISIGDNVNQTNILKDHISYVNDLSFSPSSSHLISVGQDRSIVVWNWAKGTLYRRLKKHEAAINSVVYSPDGSLFATGGKDQRIFLWPTGDDLQHDPKFVPLEVGSEVIQLAFHPSIHALTWIDEVSLKMWDLTEQYAILDSRLSINQFSFSPDGTSIVVQGEAGVLYKLNGLTFQAENQIVAHGAKITGLAYSPDGNSIATCGLDGFIRCWDAHTGTLKWEKEEASPDLQSLTWSPDSQLIAIGRREHASLWKADGEHWRQFRRHDKPVQAVAFAPSCPNSFSYVLATASRDKTIAVHRIR